MGSATTHGGQIGAQGIAHTPWWPLGEQGSGHTPTAAIRDPGEQLRPHGGQTGHRALATPSRW